MIIGSTKDLDTTKRLIVWFQPNLNLHKPKGNPIMSNSFFARNLLASFHSNRHNTAGEPASYTTTPSSSQLNPWSTGVHPSIPTNPKFLPGLQGGDNEGFESPQYTEQFLDSVTAALFDLAALIKAHHPHNGIQEHTKNQEKIASRLSLLLTRNYHGETLADAIIRKATEQKHDDVIAEAISLVLATIAAFSTPPELPNYQKSR